jgi:hypothetical protein
VLKLRGFSLWDEILDALDYAFDERNDLLSVVMRIREGTSYSDMIQDLRDENQVGTENPEPLKKINFNMGLLDEAASLAEKLQSLHAQASNEKGFNEARIIRDQFQTYLHNTMRKVRKAGWYVFKGSDRQSFYASEYKRSQKRSYTSKETPEQQEATAA